MMGRLPALKHPLRAARPSYGYTPTVGRRLDRRSNTTVAVAAPEAKAAEQAIPAARATDVERKTGSFYISHVFPTKLVSWDFRPSWAAIREEAIMEQLQAIGSEITGNDFRIENWEIARKDGGVFLHFSYVPPKEPPVAEQEAEQSLSNALPPEMAFPNAVSPGRLFMPQLLESAKHHGGFPTWLGQWWARLITSERLRSKGSLPGHSIWTGDGKPGFEVEPQPNEISKSGGGRTKAWLGVQAAAGGGRAWMVKGRQWTEDMNRFPSNRLRVEFDGPDVSQETLYKLFRPYGRLTDITPPSPVPAGSLRFASVSFSRLGAAAVAINCLHGYSTPTNSADFRARYDPGTNATVPLSRLRLYYERPLKAHAIRDWISGHPRLVIPLVAFLIGTLSYTLFDPIRAFFVRTKLTGTWDPEQYWMVKWMKQKLGVFNKFTFGFLQAGGSSTSNGDAVGKNAWQDRVEAEKSVERWLAEYPSTFITITGPPGSGKASLVNRVLKHFEEQPTLVIDCAEVGKAKNDAELVSALADETGYYPVFSFLSSLNGLIDLASVGLIGQKAGFSTPVDQQLRSMLEVVGGALKDVSTYKRQEHIEEKRHAADSVALQEEKARRRDRLIRGGWHDGRLDCVAGNGVMSELGYGDEEILEDDMEPVAVPLMDATTPIAGEAVPPTGASIQGLDTPPALVTPGVDPKAIIVSEIDDEAENIKTLPIVVLKNFAQKTAKGDLWNVMSEWGASLVENKVAHVIVVTDGPTATKALTRALPSKPLNSVGLADADEENSLGYVKDKLRNELSIEDAQQINKLGGRMIDLETLVYKVRTGGHIRDAVDDIVLRNVVELRKQAFGDDAEDAKSLPWSRAQAWKIVSDLAKSGEVSHAKLLQEFPFKGSEAALKAMEEHELVSVVYHEGRASKVKPGKPVYRYAFQTLCNDSVFKASCQIEYNTVVIAKAQDEIKGAENELATLQGIATNGGDTALGIEQGGFLGIGKSSAVRDRARWLLEKMSKNVDKVGKIEAENAEMMKVLSSGAA